MRQVYVLLIFVTWGISGFSQLSFSNNGHRAIRVAVGYFDSGCQCWKTKGWYKIEPDETEAILNRITPNGNYYYYATIDGCNLSFSGDSQLLVDPRNAFDISHADKGSTQSRYPSYTAKGFHHISPENDGNFTVTLTQHNLVCNGKRDGEWKIYYDKDWDVTEDPDYQEFYREIKYKNGSPKGWVKDFYASGQIQWEGKLLSENPDVVDGTATWYHKNGLKQQECKYNNGALVSPCQEWNEDGTSQEYDVSYQVETLLSTQKFVINGGARNFFNLGKSRITLPIQLPPNTVEWYYEFSSYQSEEDINRVAQNFSLAADLSSAIDKSGLTSGLINLVSKPPGEAYCDVFLLDSWNGIEFENHEAFRYKGTPSRENFMSGVVPVKCCNSGLMYLGFRNPSSTYPINVAVQVVAVVAKYTPKN